MELWIVYEGMYHDWACENGSTFIYAIYDDEESAIEGFSKFLENEIAQNEEFVTDYGRDLAKCMEDIRENSVKCINLYATKYDYDMGCNYAELRIEKKLLNESGVVL